MNTRLPQLAIAAAAIVLAIEPAQWLVRTWSSPAFDSAGGAVFAGTLVLVLWSLSSPLRPGAARRAPRLALAVLTAATLARLAGHLLAIDVLGGLSLAGDAWAVATLLRLDQRTRAVRPAGVALLVALSLPLERLVQRLLGYPLQLFAATVATPALGLTSGAEARREGTRIVVGDVDVLIDLPCSGAQGLFLTAVLAVALASVQPPRRLWLPVLAPVVLAGAAFGNTVRIVLVGLSAHDPTRFFGWSLLEGAGHEAAGIIGLLAGLVPVALFVRAIAADDKTTDTASPRSAAKQRVTRGNARSTHIPPAAVAIALALVLAGVCLAPSRAIDVSRTFDDLATPVMLDHWTAHPAPLTAAEAEAYASHGGSAVRALYGPHSLLLVRTSSPLRHLHDPSECLRATGFRVHRLGIQHEPLPSAVYRAEGPNGAVWHVAVTFVSDDGVYATSVAEVVWHWLQRPSSVWTAWQRVTPWTATDTARFENAVRTHITGASDDT